MNIKKTKTKTKTQGKQYLIKQVTFTERNCVGCLLFSPTFTCGLSLCFFLHRYLSNNYQRGKGNWPLRRGKTLKMKNLMMRRADNIVTTGLLTTNLSWQQNGLCTGFSHDITCDSSPSNLVPIVLTIGSPSNTKFLEKSFTV